ncbi:UNVERIFIED_ORG: uncharacterized protein DUF4297 [Martelella mediterranea]
MNAALQEIVLALSDPLAVETGGSHNQKGIEFQKNWAIVKMFALKDSDAVDFLFLFEAIQDVAVLDSSTSPASIEVFQVKKKDRNEWTWASLTHLHVPYEPSKNATRKKKTKPLDSISDSPIGKLFGSLAGLKTLSASGRFISNAGCDLKLGSGGNAATSLPVAISALPPHFTDLLQSALDSVQKPGHPRSDLSKVLLERVDIPVDDAQTYTIGIVHKFLDKTSPKHAGQARSFVESLLAKLGPLGTNTVKATTIEEMKSRHGFSFYELNHALGDLQQTTDVDFHLNEWLVELRDSLTFWEKTQIRTAFSGIYTRKLIGSPLPMDIEISESCDTWLAANPMGPSLVSMFDMALAHLRAEHSGVKLHELQAHFLLKAIEKCVDPS